MSSSTLRKGRQIDFGFEPCANAFFDFYVTPRYIDPPLLQLEDISFFLFLRKNVNVHNPSWNMPSMRQMMRRLGVSQRKLEAMMGRLIKAGLLEKVSGYRAGENDENIPNDYLLSDPLPTLEEFLVFASHGDFEQELKPSWKEYIAESISNYPVREMHTGLIGHDTDPVCVSHTGIRELHTDPVREAPTHKQTSLIKQNGELDCLWDLVLETLKLQLPKPTFDAYLVETRLLELNEDSATISLKNPKAKDWIENRAASQIKMLLSIERKGEKVKELIALNEE